MTKRYKHLKRGTTYKKVADASFQISSMHIENLDGETVVVYQSEDTGKIYVRPKHEFEDGRFEEIPENDVFRKIREEYPVET